MRWALVLASSHVSESLVFSSYRILPTRLKVDSKTDTYNTTCAEITGYVSLWPCYYCNMLKSSSSSSLKLTFLLLGYFTNSQPSASTRVDAPIEELEAHEEEPNILLYTPFFFPAVGVDGGRCIRTLTYFCLYLSQVSESLSRTSVK